MPGAACRPVMPESRSAHCFKLRIHIPRPPPPTRACHACDPDEKTAEACLSYKTRDDQNKLADGVCTNALTQTKGSACSAPCDAYWSVRWPGCDGRLGRE